MTGFDAPPGDGSTDAHPVEDLTSLAAPNSRLDRVLGYVPRVLSSKGHVMLLIALGVYLVVLPLAGAAVSAKAELIGGNYTNVTSDVGACIAAGGTLHLVRRSRQRHQVEAERLRLTREIHALLRRVHPEAAAALLLPAAGSEGGAAGGPPGADRLGAAEPGRAGPPGAG